MSTNLSASLTKIFTGKNLILGVTGGIAIYKSCELARALTKSGAHIDVVMTNSATKMIATEVFSALTNNNAWYDQWQQNSAGKMAHIELSRRAQAILIAPCTANTMAKISNGLADDLLSTLVLGRTDNCKLMLAPAMNKEMWANYFTQENLARLKNAKINIFSPQAGELACGETGQGRMSEPDDLLALTARELCPQKLANKKILFTLGSTFEKIDPVRGITNISSGKMGVALAKAAWLMGADVYVVAGGGVLPFINVEDINREKLYWQNVESAQEMYQAVTNQIKNIKFSAFIAVAAVADYRPKNYSEQKIKKNKKQSEINIGLTQNPDILFEVAKKSPHRPQTVIGFAAESEKLLEYAKNKLANKNLDYIIANQASFAFNNSQNCGFILSAGSDKTFELITQDKELMALSIFENINI